MAGSSRTQQLNPLAEFLVYGLLLIASVMVSFFILLAAYLSGLVGIHLLFFFLPSYNQGLSDHMIYAETIMGILGIIIYLGFLVYATIKTKSKVVIPWVIVAIIELLLLLISAYNRNHEPPYGLAQLAEGWLQLTVLIPIVVGFAYFLWIVKTGHPKKVQQGSS